MACAQRPNRIRGLGLSGKTNSASIPKRVCSTQDVVSFRDILKLIVSTTEVPATLLERDDLGVATRGPRPSRLEAAVPKSAARACTTGCRPETWVTMQPRDEAITDWNTSQVTIITVHPRDGVVVPAAGEKASLSDVVSIQGHPGLKAKSRLTTFAEGTRDAGNLALPSVFRHYPELASPFQFSHYRDGDAGLERDRAAGGGRTPQGSHAGEPADRATLRSQLALNEYVLPLAFDPETAAFPATGCVRAPQGQHHASGSIACPGR